MCVDWLGPILEAVGLKGGMCQCLWTTHDALARVYVSTLSLYYFPSLVCMGWTK